MLALEMLIYARVNCAFSSFAGLKLALVIQLLQKNGVAQQTCWTTPFILRVDICVVSILLDELATGRYVVTHQH